MLATIAVAVRIRGFLYETPAWKGKPMIGESTMIDRGDPIAVRVELGMQDSVSTLFIPLAEDDE